MKVYELLDSEDKWTQRAYARDKNNKPVPPYSAEACKWCVRGAIDKCYGKEESFIHEKLNKYLIDIYRTYAVGWNDNSTYEEVINIIRKLDI